jgi:inner membrane protein
MVVRRVSARLVILPESLDVRGRISTEVRQRGIYKVPVYALEATLAGRFSQPEYVKLGVDTTTLDWSRATLSLGLTDPRGLREQVVIDWNGTRLEFLPGAGGLSEAASGIHAELGPGGPHWGSRFTLPLSLRGTKSFYVAPFGKMTHVELSGAWPSPSFQGPWLPAERQVSGKGFVAQWYIPDLGRNYDAAWTDDPGPQKLIGESCFGLDLLSDVDAYRMCDRTAKYAALFFILTFTVLWLLEVLGGRLIHPIQYALIAAVLCMFLLLELSLSEHVGFGLSYLLASLAVVALVTHYAVAALGDAKRGVLFGAGLGVLYLLHYFVLRNEDYALLMGSLLLFGTLAVVMVVTRRVNWYDGATGAMDPTER